MDSKFREIMSTDNCNLCRVGTTEEVVENMDWTIVVISE
jgi:hypothetical protein